jgi:hypothetical protein
MLEMQGEVGIDVMKLWAVQWYFTLWTVLSLRYSFISHPDQPSEEIPIFYIPSILFQLRHKGTPNPH